ncbi:hypothetical protein ACSSS7_003801 [Eimeria intestinalis]
MGLAKGPETRKFFVPDFRRDPSYSKLTEEDRKAFCASVADPESQLFWVRVPAESEQDQTLSAAAEGAATLSTVATYTTDWLGIYTPEAVEGSAAAVLLPRSTEEVQRILKHCSKRRLAVCIQAGNTGLVGGSVPVFDEVVLSLRKMNRILSFDAETGVLVVEAGCLLSDVESFLADFSRTHPRANRYDLNEGEIMGVQTSATSFPKTEEKEDMQYPTYMYPLDLGSKGSCCVGGTVASAAGGNRYLRYGGAHKHVLGLEAVTGEGRVLQHLNTSQKNNESLHLHQLLIGSEGVLGVITKVAIQCVPAPRSTTVTLFALKGPFGRVRRLCLEAKEILNDILSALEFFDETCMRLTTHATGLPHPFSSSNDSSSGNSSISATDAEARHPSIDDDTPQLVKNEEGRFYLLLETHGQCPDTDSARVEEFAAQLQEQQTIDDAVLAMTETQKTDTWRLREDIAVASASACLKVLKFDVSINVARMYEPVELLNALFRAGEKLDNRDFPSLLKKAKACLIRGAKEEQEENQNHLRPLPAIAIGYGHVGDGNIHINVLIQHSASGEEVQEIQQLCDKLVYGFVRSQKGSISAEHGIGVLKAAAVPPLKGSDFMHLVTGIKRCFDPNNILNPYKGWRDIGAHTAV